MTVRLVPISVDVSQHAHGSPSENQTCNMCLCGDGPENCAISGVLIEECCLSALSQDQKR